MKTLPALAVLLASCQSQGRNGPEAEPRADLVLAAQITFDIGKIRSGEWARYTIREESNPNPRAVKFAAVGGDEHGVWIENKVPGDPNPYVIKSKFSWKGEILEQWVGEAGSPKPAKTFPSKNPRTETRKTEEPKVATKIEEESVTAAGRAFACAKITTTLTYSDGRTSTLTNWCAPEVPFSVIHGGKAYGGLVKRVFGKFTMELANFGADAQPELAVPED